jgi:hypothetical protein
MRLSLGGVIRVPDKNCVLRQNTPASKGLAFDGERTYRKEEGAKVLLTP